VLIKGPAQPASDVASQPISQSTAVVLLVMVVGISFYLWRTRYLRSRAALIFVAMIIVALLYFAVWTNPITSP
jgi:uncharacterized membrane protein YbaN (DUF454 family)